MERLDDLFDKVQSSQISTGFKSLDKILDGGFSKGLYILGAMPAIGKTSLVLQIASNIAEAGKDVLIFSLLQSARELLAKILSRFTYENNKDSALNAIEIWHNQLADNEIKKIEQKINREEAIKRLKNIADRIFISTDDNTINDIRERIKEHIKITGNIPFVIIDYIQAINPLDYGITDKQITDKNIIGLKHISNIFNCVILGISSINRSSYEEEISSTSFKESGMIECLSDVLMGLQYREFERRDFETNIEYNKRKCLFYKELEKISSKGDFVPLQLKILKNRYGITGKFDIFFKPPYSYFTEDENETIKWGTVIPSPKKRGRKSKK